MSSFWSCPPLWQGQTAFIVGAGPSLAGFDFNRIRGARVIALKAMWEMVPWADFMLFTDDNWMPNLAHRPPAFAGNIVTIADRAPADCLRMKRGEFAGLSDARDTLNGHHTVAHFALNQVKHLRPARCGLLGIDLYPGARGETHCHAPHPIDPLAFAKQYRDLATTVDPLRAAGIEVFNCTPGGIVELWPRCNPEALL